MEFQAKQLALILTACFLKGWNGLSREEFYSEFKKTYEFFLGILYANGYQD